MLIEGMSVLKRPGGGKVESEANVKQEKDGFTDIRGADEAKAEL